MASNTTAPASNSTPVTNEGPRPDQFAQPLTWTPEELALMPHDNVATRLNVVIWLLIGLSGGFLGLRVYCKFSRRKGLWWDDIVLIGAWICLTVESGLLTAMTRLGYGLHFWDFDVVNNMAPLLLLVNVAGTFSVTAAIWSKTSFAITLLRLTHGWMKGLLWFIIITMNIAMGLTALFPWVSCTPINKAWEVFTPGKCWDPKVTVHYNIFSASYSAVMDIALALLPWSVVWKLQMKKKERFGCALAMSMGVFAGITGIIKTSKMPSMLSSDFADGVDLFIWGNAESAITIMAASIPILRVLVRDAAISRRYYKAEDSKAIELKMSASEGKHSGHSRSKTDSENNLVVTVVSAGPSQVMSDGRAPVMGEKDGWRGPRTTGQNQIVRTEDFSLEYHNRKSMASDSI
ncbi:hypothetical protein QBC32DRAFT_336455 [Pseudoneurospora amorphoporcata]|uniref:Rhodopsin domain-containing protein n=1 Tax=Pseudoneurospora amorphoporcata TaxID=241081 RepID=A0AAN6NYL2_9PEZI|nr:hypothetical protein QBC32DRAFT_336455 [Pseudoneurospora amorphoporcata]